VAEVEAAAACAGSTVFQDVLFTEAGGQCLAAATTPRDQAFSRYGGRGITVCERWHDFVNFLADMGERQPGLSLDRIDNNGNYEPGNCRWATRKQQQRNKRNNVLMECQWGRMPVTEVAERAGIKADILWGRLYSGWPMGRLFEAPAKRFIRPVPASSLPLNARFGVSVAECAYTLSIDPATVYELINDGQLVATQIGRCRIVHALSLLKLLERRTIHG
jgi:hypothetical protein